MMRVTVMNRLPGASPLAIPQGSSIPSAPEPFGGGADDRRTVPEAGGVEVEARQSGLAPLALGRILEADRIA